MNSQPPIVSVIIPTHNRSHLLRQTLKALCSQRFRVETMEVIIVADGCTDDTVQMLNEYNNQASFSLVVTETKQLGPGAARNAGADLARGGILIFLDDDIQASPQLVEAHYQSHQPGLDRVVIGYLPPVLQTQSGLFKVELHGWWEGMFSPMRHPGHRFTFTDLLSGNFSIRLDLFQDLGGFNPELKCHEDYEFGYRLIQKGVTFIYNEDAVGHHLDSTTLEGALQRKYQEGIADVMIGRLHPELRSELLMTRLMQYSRLTSILLRRLAFMWPRGGGKIVDWLHIALRICERFKFRHLWLRVLFGIMNFHYWHGVAQELQSMGELANFLENANNNISADETEIDLTIGIKAAEQRLDELRPLGIRIYYGEHLVGTLPPQPGYERWRGVHLLPVLNSKLAAPLLRTLAVAGALQDNSLSAKILREIPKSEYE